MPAFEALERFADDPLVTLGVKDLDEHGDDPGADDRPPDAGPDGLQLRDAVVPQRRQPAQRRRRERHQPALHHHRHAAGAQQRGRPVVGARQRRRPGQQDNYLHTNPYPNTASPGQPKECEAGNEPFLVGKQVIGNVPGTQSANDREDDAAALMLGRRDIRRRARAAQGPHGREPLRGRRSWCSSSRASASSSGFTKHIPFTHGFRVKAVFQSSNSIRKNSPVRIAGVNVGKVTKIEGKPGSDAAVVTMEIDDKGLPIHKDADAEDPPADLPRGQLLRRRHAGHAVGADHRRRRHDPDHPDGDAGAARPGADHAPERHARRPAEDARRARHRPDLQAAEGAGPRRRPQRSRRERGPVAERRHPLRRALAAWHRDRRRRLPGHRAPRPVAAHRRARAGPPRAWGATRRSSRTSSRTSTRRWRRPRREAANLRASIRLLGPTLQNAEQRAGRAERLVPEHARLRARDPARGQARRPPPSTPRSRGSRRRASCSGPPSCRASRAELARRRATWPRSSTRRCSCCRRPT